MSLLDDPASVHASDATTKRLPVYGEPRLVTFSFGEVVVYAASAYHRGVGAPQSNRWPCPGCGRRRFVVGGRVLDVADLPGERNERKIVVCAACARHVQHAPPYRSDSQDREEGHADVL